MTLYLRLAAYLGAALLLVGGGWYLGGLAPKKALAQLQAADWQAKFQASQVALAAIQGQLKQAQSVSASNAKAIEDLNDENAKISASWASDRALAVRLLNAAKTIPTHGPTVPEAKGGQPIAPTGATSGDGQIADLLADAAAECERNAVQLNSLIAEISPQL